MRRPFLIEPSISAADMDAYAKYQQFCQKLGIKPATSATYLKETRRINSNPIAWTGVWSVQGNENIKP